MSDAELQRLKDAVVAGAVKALNCGLFYKIGENCPDCDDLFDSVRAYESHAIVKGDQSGQRAKTKS